MVKVDKFVQGLVTGLVEWLTLAPGVPSNAIDLVTKDCRLPHSYLDIFVLFTFIGFAEDLRNVILFICLVVIYGQTFHIVLF